MSNENQKISIPKEAVLHLLDSKRGGSFSSKLKKGAAGTVAGLFGASLGIAGFATLFQNSPALSDAALQIARGGSLSQAFKFADIIYRLDPDGKIVFISNAVENYGYKARDLIGKTMLEFIHPEDRDKAVHRPISANK